MTWTMFSWRRLAAARASRSKRMMRLWSSDRWGWRILSTTGRSSDLCTPRYTVAMPPLPIFSCSSKPPKVLMMLMVSGRGARSGRFRFDARQDDGDIVLPAALIGQSNQHATGLLQFGAVHGGGQFRVGDEPVETVRAEENRVPDLERIG